MEGEKWSFRRTHCLITFSLFRTAMTLESAEPEDVNGPGALHRGIRIELEGSR